MSNLRRRAHASLALASVKTTSNKIVHDFPFLPSLVGGFFGGCFVMFLIMSATSTTTSSSSRTLEDSQDTALSSSSSSSSSLRLLDAAIESNSLPNVERQSATNKIPNKITKEDGWHPIHVFYGDRSALTRANPDQKYFAQVNQDKVILDLLGPSGYFIDLAANDALEWTNTLALENQDPGWDGLCIEPNPVYWHGLSHRRCTVVGALMGETKQQVDVKFRGVFGGIVGHLDEKLANRKKEPDAQVEKRYTAPIVDVLKRFDVPHVIDYMSLDIEGAEYLVMQHFPFEEYQIKVLTVERPNGKLKALLEEKGYVFLKDLVWWGETLWAHNSTGFTPDHPKIAKIKTEGRN